MPVYRARGGPSQEPSGDPPHGRAYNGPMTCTGPGHAALLLTALALLAVQPARAETSSPTIEEALPPDAIPEGWARSGELWVYPGERLFEHINGGAEIHLELGFTASRVQRYTDGSREISVEVFEMRDEDAATGLFQRRYAGGFRIPQLGFRHAIDTHGIQLLLDRAVIVISSGRGEPELLLPMVRMAQHMAGTLPRGDHASLFDPLPAAARVLHSERVIRGPLTLRDAAPVLDGDPLLLAGNGTAVSAEYRSGDGRSTVIVATYDDAERANRARLHLMETLAPGKDGPAGGEQTIPIDGRTRATVALDDRQLTLTIVEGADAGGRG